jgi:glutathione synthase/RimK-type ligase-like ATP-grasp enzyme
LLEALGLNFGAIDLVESKGSYFFIEINPTGEWGWLVGDERRFDAEIAAWLIGEK